MQVFQNINENQRIKQFVWRTEMAKRFRDARARVHQDYYSGKQYYRLWLNQSGPSVILDTELLNGMILDYSSVAIDYAVANITGVEFQYEGIPASSRLMDQKSAEAATAVLRDHAYRNSSRNTDIAIAYQMALCGEVALRQRFDPNILATQELTAEEAEMMERMAGPPIQAVKLPNGNVRVVYKSGGTSEHLVDACLIFPEDGPLEWRDVTRFAVVEWPSVYAARLEYPDKAEYIKPVNVVNRRSGGTSSQAYISSQAEINSATGDRFDQMYELTRIVQYWEKNDYGMWDMQIRCGNDYEVVLVDRQTSPLNPYVLFQARPTQYLWSKSLYDGMRKPQFTINKFATEQLSYFVSQLKDVLFVPQGTDTSPLTNDYSLVVEYDASTGQVPRLQPMDSSVHQVIQNIMGAYVDGLFQFGQISSVTRGDTKTRLAARAIEVMTDNNSEPLMLIRQRLMEGRRQAARVTLQLAQENYGLKRLASIVGPYGDYMSMQFQGTDILAGTDVHVVASDRSPKAYMERMDMAIQAYHQGLWNPEAAEVRSIIDRFARDGNLREFQKTDEVFAERQACNEEELIAAGMVTFAPVPVRTDGQNAQASAPPLINVQTGEPILQPTQIMSIHLASHTERMNDPDYPAQAKRLLYAHIAEHQALEQQNAEAQQAQYIKSRQDESLADAAGPIAQTAVAKMGDETSAGEAVKGNPSSGGRNSGRTRSRQ